MPYPHHPERHAFIQERPWIILGSGVFTFIAGYINVVLLGFFHVPVSHMSGAISKLGMDVGLNHTVDLKSVVGIIGGFFFGALCSGFIIGGRQLVPGRRYGVVLILESFLLLAATGLLMAGEQTAVVLSAMACGLQNAMASSYYGLVLRSTHVTGIVTDIGVMIGCWMRHKHIEIWKLLLLCTGLCGFFAGGVAGAICFQTFGVRALFFASFACFASGFFYFLWKHFYQIKEI